MTDRPVITVGAAPEAAQFPAQLVDGQTAGLMDVHVRCNDTERYLDIRSADGASRLAWRYDDLRALPDQAGEDAMIVFIDEGAAARLIVKDTDGLRFLTARAGFLRKSSSHVRKLSIAKWAVAAVASVYFIIAFLIPVMADRLATFMPPEGEKALGDATFDQISRALAGSEFGLAVCEDPAGLAALQKIEDRLTADVDLTTDLTVRVLNHSMINAFALPGGNIIFFDGLIEAAGSAEEIAAVFAHEIGHVQARDPTRIALRSAGSIGVLGLLFGDFAGGALILFLAETIIQADYTQEAEAAADTFAHQMLLDANLPPSAIGRFFDRIVAAYGEEDEDSIIQHFMSHPAMGDRIEASRNAEPQGFTPTPLLTDAEFAALQGICDGAFPSFFQ